MGGWDAREREREGRREGGREGGRKGGREGGKEGGREGGREEMENIKYSTYVICDRLCINHSFTAFI